MRVDSHCSTALFVAYMLYFRPEWLIITVDTLMLCYCEEKRTGPEVTKPTQQPAQVELPPPNTVSAASPQPVPVAVGVVPVVAAGVVTPEMVATPPS